MKIFELLVLS